MDTKIRVPDLKTKKEQGVPITALTAYDCRLTEIMDDCGIDVLLVGDSLGNVVYGFETTLPVTMEMMISHTAAVARGRQKALIVADMPFMSYQVSVEEGVRNAGRLVKEGGAEAVKLEGGHNVTEKIRAIVNAEIPVMGHIGLKPQAINTMGGYKIQGKKQDEALNLIEEAKAIEQAGAFSIVLECLPAEVAEVITKGISIPTIGIGAGAACDGQVLVINDMLGISAFRPRFVRNFAMLADPIREAVKNYIDEVKRRSFPSEGESFSLKS